MKEIYDSLACWKCDVKGALERFMFDDELFCQCLKSMANDDSFEALRGSLEQEDIGNAFDSAHTLKGIIGNMGITPMLVTINKIVDCLRKDHFGNEPTPDFRELSELYNGLSEQNEKLKNILSSNNI